HFTRRTNFAIRAKRQVHPDLASIQLTQLALYRQLCPHWSGTPKLHFQGGCHATDRLLAGAHLDIQIPIDEGCRRSSTVAAQQGSNQAAVYMVGHATAVNRLGGVAGHGIVAVPVALKLMPVGIMFATTVAMAEVVGIKILKRFNHMSICCPQRNQEAVLHLVARPALKPLKMVSQC